MRRWTKRIAVIIAAALVLTAVANIEVTSLQGVDHEIRAIRMPLYLKVLDFFDRHFHYGMLVKEIVGAAKADEEKVSKILEWTHANIRHMPPGLPVVDDHVWHIIVRGYGTYGQSADVFTALCNYARLDAFYEVIDTKDRSGNLVLAFVKVGGEWRVFDPYYGILFKNREGGPASLEDLRRGNWVVAGKENSPIDYRPFFENIPEIKRAGLRRSTIQSPLKRLLFEMKKILRGKQYAGAAGC